MKKEKNVSKIVINRSYGLLKTNVMTLLMIVQLNQNITLMKTIKRFVSKLAHN